MVCKHQQRNGVFCSVRADCCADNNDTAAGTVFSLWCVPRSYKHDKYKVSRELLVVEAGDIRELRRRGMSALEATTKQRLVKTVTE
jgi:hypothetical protein